MCKSLSKVKLPQNLSGISAKTFYGCSFLEEIKLPESVIQIGPEAFRGCKMLPISFRKYNYTTRRGMIYNYDDIDIPLAGNIDKGEFYNSLKDFEMIEEDKHFYLGNSKNPHMIFCGHRDA